MSTPSVRLPRHSQACPVPRVPHFHDHDGVWEHVGSKVEIAVLSISTGMALLFLWGMWELACWIKRLLVGA